MLRLVSTIVVLVAITASGSEAVSLAKRHQLSLRLGMWNQITNVRSEVGVGGVETSVESSGMLGGIAYGHWLQENLALTFSVDGMALDISTDAGVLGVVSETSGVARMMMGMKYYFAPSTLSTTVRPYIKGAAGPIIGSQSSSRVGLTVVNEERNEYAAGGQLGAGVDFVTGRHFMMGMAAGYNFMSDFDNPIGGSSNYSGPEFGFEFSWIFGRGLE